MAIAFPAGFSQNKESTKTSVNSNGKSVTRAQSGKTRATNSYTKRNYDFMLVFRLLTDNQRDQLDDFYEANQNSDVTFDYIHDGRNYTCIFTDVPEIDNREGPDLFTVVFYLTGQPT